MQTTKTIEQLEAEARAAAEALAQVKEAEERRKREERAAHDRKALMEAEERERVMQREILQKVFAALQRWQLPVAYNEMLTFIEVNGVRVYVEKEYAKTTSSFICNSRWTGRWLVVVGSIGPHTIPARYPPNKNTKDYNYPKIVEKVKERIDTVIARTLREQQEKRQMQDAEVLVTELRRQHKAIDPRIVKATIEHFNPGRGRNGEYVKYTAPQGHVYVTFGDMVCTPEEAVVMVEAWNKVQQMRETKN